MGPLRAGPRGAANRIGYVPGVPQYQEIAPES